MLDDIISPINRKINESYDEFLEKALESYSINRQNIVKNAHRITVYQRMPATDLFHETEDVYIDNQYAFSIQRTLRYEERAPGVMAMVVDVKIVKGESDD